MEEKELIVNDFIDKYLYEKNSDCTDETQKYILVNKKIEFNSCGSVDIELYVKCCGGKVISISRFYTTDIKNKITEVHQISLNEHDAKFLLSLFAND
jgi:hypothetical protein